MSLPDTKWEHLFNFKLEQWFHFHVTWNWKIGLTVYVDGILRATSPNINTNETIHQSNLIAIGSDKSTFTVDEIGFWDGLLEPINTHFEICESN